MRIATVMVLIAVSVTGCHRQQISSKQPIQAPNNQKPSTAQRNKAQIYDLPGFNRITVSQNDPVALGLGQLIRDYRGWLGSHPKASSNQTLETFRERYNRFTRICRQQGIDVHPVRRFDRSFYPGPARRISTYLRTKGWGALLYAPVQERGKSKARSMGYAFLGEVYARKQAKDVASGCVIDIVRNGQETSGKVMEQIAVTNGRYVFMMLDKLLYRTDYVYRECTIPVSGDRDIGLFWQLQWSNRLQGIESETEIKRLLFADIFDHFEQHKIQHVRDEAVFNILSQPTINNQGRFLLKVLLESRGLLASIARSSTPLYSFDWALDYKMRNDPVDKAAGILAIDQFFGRPTIDLTNSARTDVALRLQGERAFQLSEEFYQKVLKNAAAPDPMSQAVK